MPRCHSELTAAAEQNYGERGGFAKRCVAHRKRSLESNDSSVNSKTVMTFGAMMFFASKSGLGSFVEASDGLAGAAI